MLSLYTDIMLCANWLNLFALICGTLISKYYGVQTNVLQSDSLLNQPTRKGRRILGSSDLGQGLCL